MSDDSPGGRPTPKTRAAPAGECPLKAALVDALLRGESPDCTPKPRKKLTPLRGEAYAQALDDGDQR